MPDPTSSQLRSRSFAERLDAPAHVRLPGSHLGLTWRALTREDLPAFIDLMASTADSPLGFVPAIERTITYWYDELTAQPHCSDILSGWDGQGNSKRWPACASMISRFPNFRQRSLPWCALIGWAVGSGAPCWNGKMIAPASCWPCIHRTYQSRFAHLFPNGTGAAAGCSQQAVSTPISYITDVTTRTSCEHHEVSKQARERLAAQGFTIQPYTADVDMELRRLHNRLILALERYQPLSSAAWQAKLSRADHDFSFLLIKDQQLVGYTLAEQIPEISALRIYYYGIERALRRQGIGTDLMLSVLGPAYDAQISTVAAPVVSRQGKVPESLVDHGFAPELREIVYSIDI